VQWKVGKMRQEVALFLMVTGQRGVNNRDDEDVSKASSDGS